MKQRLRYIVCVGLALWLTLTFTLSSAFAQEPLPPASSSEAPLNIVVQSINAEPGAIQWAMLLLASAFLLLMTLLLNSIVHGNLHTIVRASGRRMSLKEHIERQSSENNQ